MKSASDDSALSADAIPLVPPDAALVPDRACVLPDDSGILSSDPGLSPDGSGILQDDAALLPPGAAHSPDGSGVSPDGADAERKSHEKNDPVFSTNWVIVTKWSEASRYRESRGVEYSRGFSPRVAAPLRSRSSICSSKSVSFRSRVSRKRAPPRRAKAASRRCLWYTPLAAIPQRARFRDSSAPRRSSCRALSVSRARRSRRNWSICESCESPCIRPNPRAMPCRSLPRVSREAVPE